jgi:hypothetical protein
MRARQARTTAIVLTIAGASVLLFLVSPLVLARATVGLSHVDVVRISDVGQAYGGISALLSGVAAAGVAAALVVQIRQFKTSQAQGMRIMQIDLMKMLIAEPGLRPTSPTFPGRPLEVRRRFIYTNLMLRYLELGFEIGYFSRDSVMVELREQMELEEIRSMWEGMRPRYIASATNDAQREFVDLVESAYREEAPTVSSQALSSPDEGLPEPPQSKVIDPLALGLGIVVGAGIGTWLSRRGRPQR